jgi:hypothetical protein
VTERSEQMGAEEPPRNRIESGGDIEERQQIPGTNHFVRIGDWRNPAITTSAAAMPDLVGHHVPFAAGAVIAAELAQRYKHLSEDERTVFDLLTRLAQGGDICLVWIDEDRLLNAMDPALEREDRRRLLARMKSRGLLEEGAGEWRAVR